MVNAAEQFLTVCDCRTFVRRTGAGQPLLFLHGSGGLEGCQPFLDELANRYDVIAPDHPGYGQSETPAWLDEVADLAQFYLDFLKYLDISGVHVVGHSFGGWIALEMATRSTARIKSLTLLSSAGMFAMDADELVRTLLRDQTRIEQQKRLNPEQVATVSRNRVISARLAGDPRFFNPKLRKWLRRIDVPTHIVWGDQDKILPPTYATELQREITGAKATIIPDAGHLLHVEKADVVANAVASFVSRGQAYRAVRPFAATG